MDFTDKVVLITGASSGIGAATAIYFAKLNAKLALVGRNEKNLEETAASCLKENGLKPLTIVADVAKEADVERIMKETIDHFSKLDVLVNNAGISALDTLLNPSLATFDNVMNINVRSIYYLTSLAAPHLIKSKGSIIVNSSICSVRVKAQNALSYSMSKAAIDSFVRNIAVELGPHGVRATCVNPGLVETKILSRTGLTDARKAVLNEQTVKETPLNRLTTPTEVAQCIAFLASDLASALTGNCVMIDGGHRLV